MQATTLNLSLQVHALMPSGPTYFPINMGTLWVSIRLKIYTTSYTVYLHTDKYNRKMKGKIKDCHGWLKTDALQFKLETAENCFFYFLCSFFFTQVISYRYPQILTKTSQKNSSSNRRNSQLRGLNRYYSFRSKTAYLKLNINNIFKTYNQRFFSTWSHFQTNSYPNKRSFHIYSFWSFTIVMNKFWLMQLDSQQHLATSSLPRLRWLRAVSIVFTHYLLKRQLLLVSPLNDVTGYDNWVTEDYKGLIYLRAGGWEPELMCMGVRNFKLSE